MSDDRESHRAPLIVFGAIFAIGATTVSVVLVSHCTRDEPYMEQRFMAPNDPNRLDQPRPYRP